MSAPGTARITARITAAATPPVTGRLTGRLGPGAPDGRAPRLKTDLAERLKTDPKTARGACVDDRRARGGRIGRRPLGAGSGR